MKTSIIILSILTFVFYLISKGAENFIVNNQEERIKYHFGRGKGLWTYVIFKVLMLLTLIADFILILVKYL